jgi:hypothetical protein
MAVSLYLLMTSINCNTAFFYALFSAACCPDFCRRPLEGRGRRKLTQSQLKTLRVWAIESGRIEAQQELGTVLTCIFPCDMCCNLVPLLARQTQRRSAFCGLLPNAPTKSQVKSHNASRRGRQNEQINCVHV